MARTIAEIKKEMTDAYMSNSIIRDIYGITGDADFDSVFSPVSIESTLFYIFAATAHVIEQMFDQFKTDVEERIDANIIPTVRWYHSSALAFQYGDPLVYDPEKYQFQYSAIDEAKQLVDSGILELVFRYRRSQTACQVCGGQRSRGKYSDTRVRRRRRASMSFDRGRSNGI